MTRILVLVGSVAVLLLATATGARADEVCAGSLGAVTVDDNLVVPDGATCDLDGTVVKGNILIEPNATLRASMITVEGNIQTDDGGAAEVTVVDSLVDGDVQVFDSVAASTSGTRVGGNVQYEGNDGDLAVLSSEVDGDVQVFDNDGGTKVIRANIIGGNLQCEGNDPIPHGGDNSVGGDAEGQCSDLEDGEAPPSPARFVDVPPGHLFYDEIAALAEAGITRGCNPPQNDRFCPDEAVERQQMAAFLVRALGLSAGSVVFDDVDSSNVFFDDIAALAEAGITRGCNPPENDRFCPTEVVTRAQMAAFLVRAGLAG